MPAWRPRVKWRPSSSSEPQPPAASRYRWLVLGVFVLSSAINYLDRQTLATLGPAHPRRIPPLHCTVRLDPQRLLHHLRAVRAVRGMLIDRIGLNRASAWRSALWSCAGIATGFTRGLGGLVGCRAVLGMAEAAGIPAAGKAITSIPAARRTRPGQRRQPGRCEPRPDRGAAGRHLDRGALRMAPGLRRHRMLGLLWIPLWNVVARLPPPAPAQSRTSAPAPACCATARLWAFVAANALSMVGYSLWTNWTTLYLVDVHASRSPRRLGMPGFRRSFAAAGGFAGGWLSLRLIERGMAAPAARFRVCLAARAALAGHRRDSRGAHPGLGRRGNLAQHLRGRGLQRQHVYTLPLDTFGGARARSASPRWWRPTARSRW